MFDIRRSRQFIINHPNTGRRAMGSLVLWIEQRPRLDACVDISRITINLARLPVEVSNGPRARIGSGRRLSSGWWQRLAGIATVAIAGSFVAWLTEEARTIQADLTCAQLQFHSPLPIDVQNLHKPLRTRR
jgi:hypothetical protein